MSAMDGGRESRSWRCGTRREPLTPAEASPMELFAAELRTPNCEMTLAGRNRTSPAAKT